MSGLSVELPEFTAVQVQDLAIRHGLDWGMEAVERLMRLTDGHPYLVQVALHHISSETITEGVAARAIAKRVKSEAQIALDSCWKPPLMKTAFTVTICTVNYGISDSIPDLVSTLTRVVMSKNLWN
jgi:hypothetical protein